MGYMYKGRDAYIHSEKGGKNMNPEKILYLPIFGGERYLHAIQKIESEKVGRTWMEGYAPVRKGEGGWTDREATTK